MGQEAKSKPEREEANATTAKQVAEVKPEEKKSHDTKKVQDDHKDAKAVTSKKQPKQSGSDETKKEKMAEAKAETKKPTKAEPKEAKKSESKTADELAESKSWDLTVGLKVEVVLRQVMQQLSKA